MNGSNRETHDKLMSIFNTGISIYCRKISCIISLHSCFPYIHHPPKKVSWLIQEKSEAGAWENNQLFDPLFFWRTTFPWLDKETEIWSQTCLLCTKAVNFWKFRTSQKFSSTVCVFVLTEIYLGTRACIYTTGQTTFWGIWHSVQHTVF